MFDYETCREIVEQAVINQKFYKYPSDGHPIQVITSTSRKITGVKTIYDSYKSSYLNGAKTLGPYIPNTNYKTLPNPYTSSTIEPSTSVYKELTITLSSKTSPGGGKTLGPYILMTYYKTLPNPYASSTTEPSTPSTSFSKQPPTPTPSKQPPPSSSISSSKQPPTPKPSKQPPPSSSTSSSKQPPTPTPSKQQPPSSSTSSSKQPPSPTPFKQLPPSSSTTRVFPISKRPINTVSIMPMLTISRDNVPEPYCPYQTNDLPASYYIFIEGDNESTDKHALLEIVNDRMNEIYHLILENSEKYIYFCNNDINSELGCTIYQHLLFVDELKQFTTSYDYFVTYKSSLIKVGDYLTSEKDGCSPSSSASGGCHTIYAYLTEDLVEEVKKLPNIVNMKKSNAYSYVSIKNDGSALSTPIYKNGCKTLPIPRKTEKVTASITMEIPMTSTLTEEIPVTSITEEIPMTTSIIETPITASVKEVPVSSSKCLPVIVTVKETETFIIKETITVTV